MKRVTHFRTVQQGRVAVRLSCGNVGIDRVGVAANVVTAGSADA
ncbi:MAG: hypothetical protein WA477_06250 [Candidatus Sulfotelmatobacter sp.]